MMNRARMMVITLMLAVLLAAGVVRWHMIGAQSLWNDEGISYRLALRSLPEIAPAVLADVHPPAYFWLLHIWLRLAGESEFSLRSLSTFFSLLSVALTFALGKRLYGSAAGLAAAAFVTLNTFSIYYAQEARMYALLAAVAAGSMWAFAGFVLHHRRATAHALAFALLNTLGLYTHYSYPLLMLAQGLLMLGWLGAHLLNKAPIGETLRRVAPTFWRFVGGNALALLLFVPIITQGILQVTAQPNIAQPIAFEQMLREMQGWLAFGVSFEQSVGGMGVAMYFVLLFGLLNLPTLPAHSHTRWRAALPVVWALVSIGVFLALGLYVRYLRFLLPAQIAFALWMGRGVWVLWLVQTRERSGPIQYLPRFAALFGVFGLLVNMSNGLHPLYTAASYQRDDYRSMARSITEAYRPGDAVVLNAPNQAEVFLYYYRGQAPVFQLPASSDDAQTLQDTRAIITAHERIFGVFWGMAERDPNGVVERTLNREAYQASDQWVGNVRFVRYVTPADFGDMQDSDAVFGDAITLRRFALSSRSAQPGDVLQAHLEWETSAPLATRYKVFIQLLNPDGTLAAQRDSEPGGGLFLTTTWTPGQIIIDNHALIIPQNLPAAHYTLIVGLYDINDPLARLPVEQGNYLTLAQIRIGSE